MQNNQHEKIKKKLRIVGFTLLAIGFIFAMIGFIDFFATNDFPTKFWCLFVGIPLLGIGGMLTLLSFQREMHSYAKNESVPVINEASEELSPAIRNTAQAIKDGLLQNEIVCSCGKTNEIGDKFCSGCGKQLSTVCPHCGKTVEASDIFCGECGKQL